MHRAVAVSLLLLSSVQAVSAQFWDRLTNPQVTVTLTHPPDLGLKVDTVAFGQTHGQCSDEFLDAVVADFVNNGKTVVDRQRLESILAEHNFSLTSYVDKSTAAELGRILGPSALVFLKVQRCATEKKTLYRDWNDLAGKSHRTYISKVDGYFKASIQTVDLATARIFTAQTIEATPSRQTESEGGYPEPPSEFEVLDEAQRIALARVHRMFFPWSETRKLYFFDDKDCGLKSAFLLLSGGDFEGALRQSEANLEQCKERTDVKPKVLVHAYYNVGMAHFARDHHSEALVYFAEAAKLGGGNIVAETMAECRRAQQLASDMQRVEEAARIEAAEAAPTVAKAAPGQPVRAKNPPPSGGSVEERLKKLEELYKKGLITKTEYEKKKSEILSDL